jgi:hypothetical protein
MSGATTPALYAERTGTLTRLLDAPRNLVWRGVD